MITHANSLLLPSKQLFLIAMKHTAFTKIHESIGGKMVPFAGFYMPVQYEGVSAEH
jgi:aminomethyltransferase